MRNGFLITLLILITLLLPACTKKQPVDEAAAEKIKNAIIAAENGENTAEIPADDPGGFEEYGYHLIAGASALPEDDTKLRSAIDFINWWCAPEETLPADCEPVFQYAGVCLAGKQLECYLFAFGCTEDGDFLWKREFAVDFGITKIFELNVNSLSYTEIYSKK